MSLPALPPIGEPGTVEFSPKTVEISGAQVSEALFGKDGPGFKDVLAAINPLQHIPVVGTIYRHLTGDTISPGSRLAGGLIYGGPLGLVGAAVNATIEGTTGRDMGDHVLAMVVDPKTVPIRDVPVQVAAAVAEIAPAAGPAAETKPAVGPDVTANPVAPVQAQAAPPAQTAAKAAPLALAVEPPPAKPVPPTAAAEPPAKAEAANAPLTPEAYARAMAKANGRTVPPLPVRAGAPVTPAPRPQAQGNVPELSNEQFARLLNSLTGSSTVAESDIGPPAPPTSVPVPVDYRPPARLSPYMQRSSNRLTPAGLR
jgi:hypothetical protein